MEHVINFIKAVAVKFHLAIRATNGSGGVVVVFAPVYTDNLAVVLVPFDVACGGSQAGRNPAKHHAFVVQKLR